MERWLPIPGWEGLYEVSDLGRVRRGGNLLRPLPIKAGYVYVCLSRPGCRQKRKAIHHLVLETFVGPRPINGEADHLNFDRADNQLSNLRWISHAENVKRRQVGKLHGNASLTFEQIQAIRKASGASNVDLSRQFKVSATSISRVRNGVSYATI